MTCRQLVGVFDTVVDHPARQGDSVTPRRLPGYYLAFLKMETTRHLMPRPAQVTCNMVYLEKWRYCRVDHNIGEDLPP